MSKNLLSGVFMAIVGLALVGGGCAATTGGNATVNGNDSANELLTSAATIVTSPAAGSAVSSPVRIEGTTSNPDMKIFARVLDSDQSWLVTAEVMPEEDGTYLFNAVYLFSPTGPDLTLEMYNTDSEGKEINVTQIPLVLAE